MKKSFSLIIPLLFLLILSGCEKMITEVDVPESKPKLVINSVISPQSEYIKVSVTWSQPLFNAEPLTSWADRFEPVKDALVKLSSQQSDIFLPFDSAVQGYIIPSETFVLEPGKTYSLDVSAPGGYHATATCTIPSDLPPPVEITGLDTVQQYEYELIKINFRFKDIEGPGNYYSISTLSLFNDTINNSDYFYFNGLERGEPYLSDKNYEGEYFNFRTSGATDDYLYGNLFGVALSVTDEDYFNYQRSINSFEGDSPFSEPFPIYSNIKGGLGIFAGINTNIYQFTLE